MTTTWKDAVPPLTVTLTVTGLATLASGSSATSAAIDEHTLGDNDLYVSSKISNTTTLATAFVSIFASGSIDNTTFPDSSNDIPIGTLAIPTGATLFNNLINVVKAWPQAYTIPPYIKLRYLNSTGTALTAATVTYNGYTP